MFTFPKNLIPYINMFLLVWLLVELYRGYKRGFLIQLVDFVGTIVAFFAAWLLSEPFARAMQLVPSKGIGYASIDQVINLQINRYIWVVILFIVIRIVLMVVRPLASFISKMPLIKQVNSAFGGFVSIIIFGIKVLALIFILSFPFVKNGMDIVEGTVLKNVANLSAPVFDFLQDSIDKNAAIQSIISDKSLTTEQSDAMVEWLLSKGFSSTDIQEYLNSNE